MGRILIVEDDQGWQERLSRELEHAGHEVLVASGRMAALDLLPRKPDLITMDGTLGSEKGLEIAAEIRARDQRVPIVMISQALETLKFEGRGLNKREYKRETFLSLVAGLVDG